MGWGTDENGRGADGIPPVAALLRRPSVWVRHQAMDALREAGFADVLPAHLGVFQYPGPDGQRPGVLAARARSSKQAMNHLLHQLEEGGYLYREGHPHDRRTRVIRLTERGWRVVKVLEHTFGRIDDAWREALGAQPYAHLQQAIFRLEELLDDTRPR